MIAVWRPLDRRQSDDEAVELRLKQYQYLSRLYLGHIGLLVLLVLLEWLLGSIHIVAMASLALLVPATIIAVWYRIVVAAGCPRRRSCWPAVRAGASPPG
jgi:hypothetical protein